MFRPFVIALICLALASVNLAGVHLHFVSDSHAGSAQHSPGDEPDSRVISVLDEDHDAGHDRAGNVDVDLVTNVFGKHWPSALAAAGIFLYLLIAFFRPQLGIRLPRGKPFRPPRRRASFYLLPPSQAPPTTAFAR